MQAAETDPKAKGRRADEFMDPSIYNELEKAATSSRWANSSKLSKISVAFQTSYRLSNTDV